MSDVEPIVKEMKFTSDFSDAISPHLLRMEGHSNFFQFKINKDKAGLTKLYVKEDELDSDDKFPRAIQLLNSVPDLKGLSVTKFREDSEYNKIFQSVLNKYIPTLEAKFTADQIESIKTAWEKRIIFLIDVKESDFEPFNINVLKKQVKDISANEVNTCNQRNQNRETKITATFYPYESDSFSITDVKKDDTLVFYTETKSTRPWIGLCIQVLEDGSNVQVETQWLKKDKNQYIPCLASDGKPYTSIVDSDSILFHNVLTNISPQGDRVGPYVWPDKDFRKDVMSAYLERDKALSS